MAKNTTAAGEGTTNKKDKKPFDQTMKEKIESGVKANIKRTGDVYATYTTARKVMLDAIAEWEKQMPGLTAPAE